MRFVTHPLRLWAYFSAHDRHQNPGRENCSWRESTRPSSRADILELHAWHVAGESLRDSPAVLPDLERPRLLTGTSDRERTILTAVQPEPAHAQLLDLCPGILQPSLRGGSDAYETRERQRR